MSEPERAKCRSCGAEIIWVKTANQRLMPLNAEPDPKGNLILLNGVPTLVQRDLYDKPLEEQGPRYTSHFVTCPDADKFRKKRKQ